VADLEILSPFALWRCKCYDFIEFRGAVRTQGKLIVEP
jgi:hypothetical protein